MKQPIGEYDVLIQAGEEAENHPGNHNFRRKIHLNVDIFRASRTTEERSYIVESIVGSVYQEGGRFLTGTSEGDETLVEMSPQSVEWMIESLLKQTISRKDTPPPPPSVSLPTYVSKFPQPSPIMRTRKHGECIPLSPPSRQMVVITPERRECIETATRRRQKEEEGEHHPFRKRFCRSNESSRSIMNWRPSKPKTIRYHIGPRPYKKVRFSSKISKLQYLKEAKTNRIQKENSSRNKQQFRLVGLGANGEPTFQLRPAHSM